MIPWFSTFTLFTELFITASVLYIFYSGWKHNRLPFTLTAITLAYEIIFNISYMASRVVSGKNPSHLESGKVIALAAFHGIFSLLMFIALVIFMVLAWRNYKKNINYFKIHSTFTRVFIVLWLIAVISGFLFYYATYLA
jgi:heme A synthase